MQIATWNVNSLSVRLPQVLAWLQANPVDALALQELKLTDDKFPLQALQEAGYHAVSHGQKTYNGVAWLTRTPVRDVVRNIPGLDDEQARIIAATLDAEGGPVRLINGYFVNGQAPGTDKFAYKMRSEEHTSELQSPCNLVCRLLLEKKYVPLPAMLSRTALFSVCPSSSAAAAPDVAQTAK